ncbi:unnamed protein product, partial [Brenthis ino]
MLITKYTAILLESARNAESRNAARPTRGIVDADWSSSLESAPRRRRQWRRRHVVHRERLVYQNRRLQLRKLSVLNK